MDIEVRLARILRKLIPFHCFRCGECCFRFKVKQVPGYNQKGEWTGSFNEKGQKPKDEYCNHLVPANLNDNNKWQPATCELYNKPEYPEECEEFQFCFGSCFLGIAIWEERTKFFPNAKLPDDVAKIIQKRLLIC